MTNKILNHIRQIAVVSEEEQAAFEAILEFKEVKKKDFALKEGDYCDKIFFINSGIFRLYYNIDGEENTYSFCVENCWYTDFESYLTNKKTEVNLQALEDCSIIRFKKTDIETLYRKYHNIERIGRILIEQAFVEEIEETRLANSCSAEERYLKLTMSNPELFQRIPQYHIASYLNIKPESLSRIRKRMAQRKVIS
jgi:CRP/FNR family transcriptional regulator, anaerobic regulatory protein